jgi:hypothetical protein
MRLKTVTVTGADDNTLPMEMVQVSQKFPYVEWGILFSRSSEGRNRFPSRSWIDGLAEVQQTFNLKLSAHVCGGWVRSLLNGEPGFFEDRADILHLFKRFQINTHGIKFGLLSGHSDRFFTQLTNLGKWGQFIFQQDGVNDGLLNIAQLAGIDAVPLFDRSGGTGTLPSEWPQPIGDFSGYAGGLSAVNVTEQLREIEKVTPNKTIWIDAEAKLRSGDLSRLDLGQVVGYLSAAKKYVEIT